MKEEVWGRKGKEGKCLVVKLWKEDDVSRSECANRRGKKTGKRPNVEGASAREMRIHHVTAVVVAGTWVSKRAAL